MQISIKLTQSLPAQKLPIKKACNLIHTVLNSFLPPKLFLLQSYRIAGVIFGWSLPKKLSSFPLVLSESLLGIGTERSRCLAGCTERIEREDGLESFMAFILAQGFSEGTARNLAPYFFWKERIG